MAFQRWRLPDFHQVRLRQPGQFRVLPRPEGQPRSQRPAFDRILGKMLLNSGGSDSELGRNTERRADTLCRHSGCQRSGSSADGFASGLVAIRPAGDQSHDAGDWRRVRIFASTPDAAGQPGHLQFRGAASVASSLTGARRAASAGAAARPSVRRLPSMQSGQPGRTHLLRRRGMRRSPAPWQPVLHLLWREHSGEGEFLP